MSHWHVATGLTRYGPDAAGDAFVLAKNLGSVALLIFDDLDRHMDHAWDAMIDLKENGEYQEAWAWFDVHQELDVIRHSFNPERASAPLYRDHQDRWHDTIMALIERHFPLQLDPANHVRMYVWDCAGNECVKEE